MVVAHRTGYRHPKHVHYVARTSGTYTVDVSGATGASPFALTVNVAPNDPPNAVNVVTSTAYQTPVNVDPLASDSDPNGDAITLQSVGTPGHGTVARTEGGLRYVPADGFSGDDQFGYTVCDSRTPAACSDGTVEVDVAAPVTPPPSGGSGGSDSYAPAPAMVNPTVIQLHVGGDTLRLDDSKDYILQMPDQKKTGGLVIRGGRNVEVIGGYMSIATPGPGGAGAANITISDGPNAVDGHVVRIEGVQIDASSGVEADGIRISAPKAVVQVVNDRITGLLGSLATTHADLIQPWGGVKELDVDGFTGSSHYNTFYLRRENNPLMPPAAKVVMHDVNVFGLSNPGSNPSETISAISIGTQPPTAPSDTDSPVNCQVPTTLELSNFYAQSAGKRPASFIYPRDSMTKAGCPSQVSADGTSVDWPSLRAAGGGPVTGAVQVGTPPAGDYVPVGMAGLGYVAP
jgi:Bacterial Ig domain